MTADTIKCKGLYGLGVMSAADFVNILCKYKAAQETEVAYFNATSVKYPTKATIVIFEGVRELLRCRSNIKPHQVLIVSDTPALLNENADFIAIDYAPVQPFEFNLKEPDAQVVLRAIRNKTVVGIKLSEYATLNYQIDRVTESGDFMASFIGLNALLSAEEKNYVKTAFYHFFSRKKCDVESTLREVQKCAKNKDNKILEQYTRMVAAFEKQGLHYFNAIRLPRSAAAISREYNIDQYAVSFFKRLVKNFIPAEGKTPRHGNRI